jgi:tetratricopeptide (TPR) repeat protein
MVYVKRYLTTCIPFLLALFVLLSPGFRTQAQTSDDLRERARQAMRAQDFAAARQALLQLVQREPSAENYNRLATAEAAGGQVSPAIAHLQKSIQLGNRTPSAYYNLGVMETQANQLDAAKVAFQHAIDLDPKHASARFGLGTALLQSGHPHEAAEVMQKTLVETPPEERFWVLLVSAQFAAGDSTKAVASTRNAVENFPDNAPLDVTLATTCFRYRAVQRARELLEDANESMPNNPEVALLLARASLLAGNPAEARAVLQGMAPADRQGTEWLLLMGETRALLGDLKPAEVDLRIALSNAPRDPECLATYAWLQNFQGQYEAAITTLAKARSLLPRAAWVPYRMGLSYLFLGKLGEAEEACQQALQLDPKYSPAYMLLGMVKINEKHYEDARIDFSKAVELDSESPFYHRQLGIALYDSGKAALASQQFDLALHGDPKDATGYYWRAKSLQAQGKKEKAIADLNTVIELQPAYAEAYTELARIYSETGQASRAAEVLAQQKKLGASPQPSGDDTLLRTLPDATR